MSQFNQMNTTIVESVAVANVIHLFGRNPIQVTCPACHQQVLTQIREEDGGFVWASVIVLCFIFPVLSCLPLCVREFRDFYHICPNCNATLGVKKPFR